MTAHECPGPIYRAWPLDADRKSGPVGVEVGKELFDRRVASIGILFERVQDNVIEIAANSVAKGARQAGGR
jgi:hypothetical protein